MIETICPNCGNKKTFDDSYAGRTFRCPNCKEPVTIQSVVEMVKDETDSHEISFEAQIKKAEEEKKRKEKQQAYKAELKKLNDSYSSAKIILWCLAGFAVLCVISLFNDGFYDGILFWLVVCATGIVYLQIKRKKLLQQIEDLKSSYLKKSSKK